MMVVEPAHPVMVVVMPGARLGQARRDSGESGGDQSRLDDLLHVGVSLVSAETAISNGRL